MITRNLPPLLGGMERLNYHIALALNESLSLMVIGPTGCRKSLHGSTAVVEVAPKPLWRYLLESGFQSLGVVLRKKPDIVIAGSGLTAPFAGIVSRLVGASSCVYLHGLDIVSSHPIYRLIWVPFFRRIDTVIVNSHNTAKLAISVGVSLNRLTVINPGTQLHNIDNNSANAFRNRYGLYNRPLLLSVGRLTRRKGLLQFVQRVLPSIVKVHPDVCLIIIGDEAPDALRGSEKGIGKKLVELATQLGIENNIIHLGTCNDATLSAAYRASNVHIFPVIDIPGDIEGFGMVALEAAAHGLPTVAFRTGGVEDAVAPGTSGYLMDAGDYHSMQMRILDILNGGPRSISSATCRKFAAQFKWPTFNTKLRKTLGLIEEI